MTAADHEGDAPEGHVLKPRGTLRFAASKLGLVSNPLAQTPEEDEGDRLISAHKDHHEEAGHGHDHGHGSPTPPAGSDEDSPLKFAKRHSASTSELFYDLWFVANLTVFATVHPIVDKPALVSFVGYFLLLWNTWFITTVFDARFSQDGILDRLARACHLAVMIGFAVAGVAFDSHYLISPIIKAMSLFLTLSRFVLALQYSLVLFHVRHHRRSRNTIMIAVALHFAPAIAYLVVGVLAETMSDRHPFLIVWYVVGLMELLVVIVHATVSKTLSFEGTHFNERLNLLTLIIIGEGVIILCKNVTKLVKYTYLKDIATSWSPSLVGILVCAAAMLYITFQLYFDWMHHHNHMNSIHQGFWAIIHLPFHAALVLLAEGGGQWALWWRALESFAESEDKLQKSVLDSGTSGDSGKVADALKKTALGIMKKYGDEVEEGSKAYKALEASFDAIKKLPSDFWTEENYELSDPEYKSWLQNFVSVSTSVINSVAEAFELSSDAKSKTKNEKAPTSWEDAELAVVQDTAHRLVLIFVYLFISAGAVLILLMLMHLLSKRKGWSLFNIFRTMLIFLIGVGLALVSTIQLNPMLVTNFLSTPWQLPTVTICYFFVLILTHVPHPPRIFFKRSDVADLHEMRNVPDHREPMRNADKPSDNSYHGVAPAGAAYDPAAYAQPTYAASNLSQVTSYDGVTYPQQPSSYDPTIYQQGAPMPDTAYYGSQHPPPPPIPETDHTPKRGMTLKRGLTMIQNAARNIHIEPGRYDPLVDRSSVYGGNRGAVGNLYNV